MDFLLTALKAAAEPTRLRLLALCAHGELTVSELTQILGQSQPRVSRHLKLLCDAGLLDRFREGTWAFYRLAERGAFADLARTLIDAVPRDDATLALDLERLNAIKRARAEAAADYFRENAARWHEMRSLHVPEREVEAALLGHPDVAECAVIGAPDEERGQIVSAFIVLKQGARSDDVEVKLLQDHVKATIAPYKYPRAIAFVEALPKTQTGKIQRFKLREAS